MEREFPHLNWVRRWGKSGCKRKKRPSYEKSSTSYQLQTLQSNLTRLPTSRIFYNNLDFETFIFNVKKYLKQNL